MFDPTKEDRTWSDIKDSCGIDDEETIKKLAHDNYEFFFEHVLGYDTGCPVTKDSIMFHQNPEKHKETNSYVDGIKTCVMAPRGHSKTVSWTMGPALWRAYRDQGKEMIVASASKSQSKDILADIKRIIVRNDALKHLEPSKDNMEALEGLADINDGEDLWAAETITTTTDVTIKVKTFGSSIRGDHVDYVFLDDILEDENSGNKSRDQEKEYFYSVISPIVENKGGILQIVGTPMAHDDLIMELIEKDSYHTTEYQAYYPEEGEVLWDDKWNVAALEEKKAELGPARFAREYMCNPMSVDEQFFNYEDCIEPNIDHRHFKCNPSDDEYRNWSFVVGVDVALSDGGDSDYNVFTVIGSPPEGNQRFVVDIVRVQTLSPSDIADELERLDNRYGFKNGFYEKNAQGEGLMHEVRDRDSLSSRIEGFDTTRTSRPQILSSLQAALYRGELKIVDKENLVSEMKAFRRNNKGKLKGKGHDDTVMSLAIAYECLEGNSGGQVSMTIIGGESEGDDIDLSDTGIVSSDVEDDDGFNVGVV